MVIFVVLSVYHSVATVIEGAPRGFGEMGTRTIYFKGAEGHW